MNEFNFSVIPKFVDNMLSPVAKEAGEALADIIKVARIPLSTYLQKNNIKLEAALNKLKKELNEIPDENIILPKAAVIGPALEALFKYYLEEDYIVDMFTKMVAASMNKDTFKTVHPKLFWDVEQMSALDCNVFNSFFLESSYELYSIHPYTVFYMTGMPFSSNTNYDIVLLHPDSLMANDILLCVKAYDSIMNLVNIGLVKQTLDQQYNTYSEKYLKSDICIRIKNLIAQTQKETPSKITLKKEIKIHTWQLTNSGLDLANILKLTKYKAILYDGKVI